MPPTEPLTPEEEKSLRTLLEADSPRLWFAPSEVARIFATLDAARSTATPDRDALPTALAEALPDALADADDAGSDRDDWLGSEYAARLARAILAHPAVAAALAGSGPAAGLREAADAVVRSWESNRYTEDMYEAIGRLVTALAATPTASPTEAGLDVERLATAVLHIHGFAGEELTTEDRAWAGSLAAEYLRLAATPTASPTDPMLGTPADGTHPDHACGMSPCPHIAASPTATGERETPL